MPVIEGGQPTHTTLECSNIPASLRFYAEALGLRTQQTSEHAGLLAGTNQAYTACVRRPDLASQPLLNYYARPVRDAAVVDAAHARLSAAGAEYGIAEITAPAREDPARFGVGTYGFYLKDFDGNWWRVEENDGPFGPMELPADGDGADTLLPPGPISYVTLECREIAPTMQFYRDFLGLQVEQRAEHYFVTHGSPWHNLVVVAVGDRVAEQPLGNHHGITVWTDRAHVDALHRDAQAQQERFELRRVMPVTHQHSSYSFYFQDRDTNWWEVQLWDDYDDPWVRTARGHRYYVAKERER
jgi:catechol 2,3-dioxygenase-like lactoylglutathione lyase family enzyme